MYTYQYGNAYSVCSILLEVESGGDGTLHIPYRLITNAMLNASIKIFIVEG